MRVPISLLVLSLASALAASPSFSATTQPAGTHGRWEYAALLTSARLCKWTSPKTEVVAEGPRGYAKLYAELGGMKTPENVSLVDLLNLVGNQGWDLVAIDGGEGPHQYIFKRAAAKDKGEDVP